MKTILRIFIILFVLLGLTVAVATAVFWTSDLKKVELEEKYSNSSSQFINVDDDRIHLQDTGNKEGPAIVFIHGFGASLHTWEEWSKDLNADYRVIRFDLPGFGLSGPDQKGDYSDDRTNLILLEIMNQLKLKKINIVGNSIGGRMAWYFTAKYPELVSKLVLISPDGFESPGMMYNKAPEVPSYMNTIEYFFPKFMFRENLEFAYANKSFLTQPLFDRYYELALLPGNRRAMVDRMRQTILKDPNLYLKDIHCPVLLLWGEKDGMIPIQNAQDYLNLMPQATLQKIPDMGHLPHEEDPKRSLPYLMDFLKE
jgi:pimeloyl-ACP methyl ester carboxylesterase